MTSESTRGAALPAALLLALWLTGITGWLIGHAVWDRQLVRLEVDHRLLSTAAESLADAVLVLLAATADWTLLLASGPPEACPGGAPPVPWSADLAAIQAQLQAAQDAQSRWDAAAIPTWRYLTGCSVRSLHGAWRDAGDGALVLAWVADDPDDPVAREYDRQVLVHVVARHPSGVRAGGTATIRRLSSGGVWMLAWRPDGT